MIVCSCNVLSEDAVRGVTRGADGAGRVAEVFERLGCRAECGRCAPTVRRLIREAVAGDLDRRLAAVCDGRSCPAVASDPADRPLAVTTGVAAE
jgi:bacterioferritin-associated ferredoxin